MPVERSDKLIRERIEGLDSLPSGFRLHTGAAWKEIEQKLHTPKRNGFAWWYAAAVVLLIMAGVLLWNNSVLRSPALQTVAVKKSIAPKKQVVPATNLTGVTAKVLLPKPVLKKADGPITINELPTDKVSPEIAVITEKPVVTIPATNTISLVPVAPNTISKKRLKVVHINELGNEPEILYSKVPLKRNQLTEDNSDDLLPSQNPRSWWQTKPKPVTTVTLSDNN